MLNMHVNQSNWKISPKILTILAKKEVPKI